MFEVGKTVIVPKNERQGFYEKRGFYKIVKKGRI